MKIKYIAFLLLAFTWLFISSCGYDTDPKSNSDVYPKQYPVKKYTPEQKRAALRQKIHKTNGKIYVADQAPRNILFERSVTVPAKKHTWVLPHNDAKYNDASNTML